MIKPGDRYRFIGALGTYSYKYVVGRIYKIADVVDKSVYVDVGEHTRPWDIVAFPTELVKSKYWEKVENKKRNLPDWW